jgi:hypothetical protein
MQEKENVLRILEETKEALKTENVGKIKNLSDETIHTASTTQDPDNIAIAVIVYSLSKIIQREQYKKYSGWKKFYQIYVSSIDEAIKSIKSGNDKHIKQNLSRVRNEINNLSGDLRKNIEDVFMKASINKASKIYEHGISMEQTAQLLGITVWDLASYAGQKNEISNINLSVTQKLKSRIKTAEEIFGR